ncbi:MAG: hypothetical protein QOI79_703, partial [Mycobacterium sp.]|nr:hypothetical protein [Mycobacterium sp.]
NTTARLLTVDAFTVENNRQISNDSGPGMTYSGGGWTYSAAGGFRNHGDDIHYSSTPGATVSYAFNGTSVSWLAQRNSSSGPVEIYLDGVDEGAVMPRTSATPYPVGQVNYEITGLAAGDHTLCIVNNTAALLTVDAFTSRY